MTKWNQDNRGNRTNLIHTGNLEFTNRGKVKFNKDLIGNITNKNIYATQINFDTGTYNVHANPVTIDGNAKINGSTFDLRHDLILNGDVEFSGNITY